MKEKCRALRVAIMVTIVSFIICLLIWFVNFSWASYNLLDFFKMLFGGVFASGFVTLFVYWSEYRSARRITLEKFWFASRDINNLFLSVKYLDLSVPSETVCGYFNEEWHNQIVQDQIDQLMVHTSTQIPNHDILQIQHKYKYAWSDKLRSQYGGILENMSTDDLEQILFERVEQDAKEYLKQLNKTIDDYMFIVQNGWSSLDVIMGQIEYFIGKVPYQKLYKEIYRPIQEMIIAIRNEVYPHFSTYKSGENKNTAVILSKLLDLQKRLFTVEDTEGSLRVYADFWTNIENKIEDFRTTIYGDKPTYQSRLEILWRQ